MRHIHTYIASRHLATRGNNTILRTPPPHIIAMKRYFPASLVVPLSNSEQINHPSSNHTYTKSTPKHIHHYYTRFVTLIYTTHIISSTTPTYAPHCTPKFVDRPHRRDCTAGQMDEDAGWWTTSGTIEGVGKQQHKNYGSFKRHIKIFVQQRTNKRC